jgi:hypothetical protein
VQVAHGSVNQNFAYCSKQGNMLVVKGQGSQGAREKKARGEIWRDILNAAKTMSPAEFATEYPEQ